MDKATKWLVEQYENPRAAYTTAEWALMSGMPSRRVYRWLIRKKLIQPKKKAPGKEDVPREKREEHVVTRDAVQRAWPDFWRSIRWRLADIMERSTSKTKV